MLELTAGPADSAAGLAVGAAVAAADDRALCPIASLAALYKSLALPATTVIPCSLSRARKTLNRCWESTSIKDSLMATAAAKTSGVNPVAMAQLIRLRTAAKLLSAQCSRYSNHDCGC